MIKLTKQQSKYIISLCIFILIWIFADDTYRSHVQKQYLNCIFTEASHEMKLGIEIYNNFDSRGIRENCAKSQGAEYIQSFGEIDIYWVKAPLWKKVLIFPTFIATEFLRIW